MAMTLTPVFSTKREHKGGEGLPNWSCRCGFKATARELGPAWEQGLPNSSFLKVALLVHLSQGQQVLSPMTHSPRCSLRLLSRTEGREWVWGRANGPHCTLQIPNWPISCPCPVCERHLVPLLYDGTGGSRGVAGKRLVHVLAPWRSSPWLPLAGK